MTPSLNPYQPIAQITPDLFYVDGEWEKSPLQRRMTIIRLSSGDLFVHSPIRLSETDFEELGKLGHVTWIVVPNYFHSSEAHYYSTRYPDAKVIASKKAVPHLQELTPIEGLLPDDWPKKIAPELDCQLVQGAHGIDESVFFHQPSRTLLVTDLIFNLSAPTHPATRASWFTRLFLKWNQIWDEPSVSRIFRWIFLKDKKKFLESIEKIMQWDFDRIMMSHGTIIETGGKAALRSAIRHVKP